MSYETRGGQVRMHHALEQLGTDCSMAEMVTLCPELTWNQVFIAIDHLSRAGQVRVTLDGDRTYRVQAPARRPGRGSIVIAGSFVNIL